MVVKVEELKLKHFSNQVMAEVTEKRDEILEALKSEHDKTYELKEMEFLTNAYNNIQEALKKIDLEKNEMTSKTIMDNRMRLLNHRAKLIEGIFIAAKEKLRNYKATDDYKEYLLSLIQEGIAQMGLGDIVVKIDATDKALLPFLEERLEAKIETESIKIDLIGGCKLYNQQLHRILDLSFASRLEAEYDDFMFNCQLDVE